MVSYKEEVKRAMKMLGDHPKTIFLGQTVGCTGSNIYSSLADVSMEKRIELPIIEDTQMGMSIGLSLQGFIPVSIFPRWDFLICATNQLVNHLDKGREMSNGQFKPKVIIRTMVGGTEPLYPGCQHCSDYTEAFSKLLKEVDVVKLENPEDVFPVYQKALESDRSTLIIEMADCYNKELITGESIDKNS